MTQGYDKGLQADRFENIFGSCRCELCNRITPPGVGGLLEGHARHRCRRCNRTVCSSCSSVPGTRDSRTCKKCDGSSSRPRDREKYLFLVRHAQSTWNRQLDQVKTVRHCSFPQLSVKDVVSSAAHLVTKEMWDRDHPISDEGVRQTLELRQKIATASGNAEETGTVDWGLHPMPGSEAVGGSSSSTCGSDSGRSHRSEEEQEESEAELRRVQRYYDCFLSKRQQIYCSPLLRALQTAHLVFPEEDGQVSIKLVKEAREHFNFVFQRDCLGTETGTQIVDRAMQISTHPGLHSIQDRVDATDCAEKWWSEEPETEADVEARLQTLWRRLLEEDETDSCVLVTHSNLIKALLMRFGGVSDFKAQPSFNESLKEVHLEAASPEVVRGSSLRRLGSFCEAAGRKLFLQQDDTPASCSQPALPHLSENEEDEEPENTCSWHVVEEGPEALRKLKVERLQNCGVLGLHVVLEAPAAEDTDADGWIDVNSDAELVPKPCCVGSQWVAKDALLMFGSVLVQ